jgi:predicted nucleic acid-binding protein
MIVADSSVIMAWLLRLRSVPLPPDEHVHVPHLIDTEVANAVRGHVRRGELDERGGWEILDTFRWLGITRHVRSRCSIGSGSSATIFPPMTRRTWPSPRRCNAL